MPPAATTGIGATASTTAGTSGSVERCAAMTTGFGALGHDDVGPRLDGQSRARQVLHLADQSGTLPP